MRAEAIATLLPAIYQRTLDGGDGDVLGVLLDAMATLHQPVEDVLDALGETFDPRRAPDGFVGYLAGWVDLDRFLVIGPDGVPTLPAGLGALRELVASAAAWSRRRGTEAALVGVLEQVTGAVGFRVEVSTTRPFHLIVHAPRAAIDLHDVVAAVVEVERPAHLTFELRLDPTTTPGST